MPRNALPAAFLAVVLGLAVSLILAFEPPIAACMDGEDCGCNSPKGCAMPCTGCCDGADPQKGCPAPPTWVGLDCSTDGTHGE